MGMECFGELGCSDALGPPSTLTHSLRFVDNEVAGHLMSQGSPHIYYLLVLPLAVIASFAGTPVCTLHTIYIVLKHYMITSLPFSYFIYILFLVAVFLLLFVELHMLLPRFQCS